MQNSSDTNRKNFSNDLVAIAFAVVGVLALLVVRAALFYNEWGDFSYFYGPWIIELRSKTFVEGLRSNVGNYNPMHMYIFNLIARTNINDLYIVKSVSVLFDFVIAFFSMKIVSLKTDSLNKQILAFLLAFAIPTVVLNSSMWGQCDSMYAAFAIGSLYFGLSGRSKSTYVFMALALSFKLQAVFVLPMLLVFVFMKKIRIHDCYLFFLVYFATLLPALLAGKPIGALLSVYLYQYDAFNSLNMNIVNVWQFVGHVEYVYFRTAGLYIAGLAVLGLIYFTYVNRARLTSNLDYIRLAYLFAILMPFLLPKMHDRYYIIADVLSVTVFLFDKRRWYVPIVSIFCSYLGYAYFLMSGVHLIDFRYAAIALMFVILVILRDYVKSLYLSTDSDCE